MKNVDTTLEQTTQAGPDRPMHVVLIEDDPIDAQLIWRMLRGAQEGRHELTHFVRVADARAAELVSEVDVVLVDLSLPDSIGIESVQHACELFPDVPIVVLTDSDDMKLASEAVRLGAQDFCVKGTLDARLLQRTIQCAIERKRNERLERQIQEAGRFESLGRMAGGIAHDFNNLLVGVLGNVELLQGTGELSRHSAEYATRIEESARRADQVRVVGKILLCPCHRRLLER